MPDEEDLFSWKPNGSTYPPFVPVNVCALFEQLALELVGKGWENYSAL